jgi:hypothetical protein
MNGTVFLLEGVNNLFEACQTEFVQLYRPEEDTQSINMKCEIDDHLCILLSLRKINLKCLFHL